MNPYDVFPRRDLPFESEPWGRFVENRIIGLENAALAADSSLQGENRTSAASLGELARQLDRLNAALVEVQGLYNALPKAAQATQAETGFSLSSGWNTVASITIPAPLSGTATISANCSGLQALTGVLTDISVRMAIGSNTSYTFPGAPSNTDTGWQVNYTLGYGWTIPVTAGQNVTVNLQLNPGSSASTGASSRTYAVLSAFATFSG